MCVAFMVVLIVLPASISTPSRFSNEGSAWSSAIDTRPASTKPAANMSPAMPATLSKKRILLITISQNLADNLAGGEARGKTVIDVDDRNTGRARVDHRQQRRYSSEAR